MNREERSRLVERLLKTSLGRAQQAAEAVKNESDPSPELVHEQLKVYVYSRLLLPPDTEEDDVHRLIELSIIRAMKLDPEILAEIDKASGCDHSSPIDGREASLRYRILKDFEIRPDLTEFVEKQTLRELADLIAACRDGSRE